MESINPDEITVGDLAQHSRNHGKKATSQLLKFLGMKRPLYDLVMSSGGKLMFTAIVSRLNDLLDKIVEGDITADERIEYKVGQEFLRHNVDILVNYKKHKDVLKGR